MLPTGEERDKFDDLRKRAEELIKRTPDTTASEPADMIELIHDLRLHQAELEVQNDELQRAQQEISELHAEFENLYELAPCVSLTLNPKGIIDRVNLSGAKFLGVDRSGLGHQSLTSFISEDCRGSFFRARRMAADSGEIQRLEVTLVRPDLSVSWARLHIQAHRAHSGELAQWSVVIEDMSHMKQRETKLRESLDFNEHLLRELQHRVNNSLSLISSLISIEARRSGEKEVMESLRGRVKSIANLYLHLYETGSDDEHIDIGTYLRVIIDDLEAFSGGTRIVRNLASTAVSFKTALSVGLITNELVANALKHGFRDMKEGTIEISLREDHGKIILEVANDGEGFRQDFKLQESSGTGLELVRLLVEHHGGTLELGTGDETRVIVELVTAQQQPGTS